MKGRHKIILYSLLLTLLGCVDLYDPGIEEGSQKLTVEGLVTDQPGPYYVRLSLSGPYNNDNITLPVGGASVYVADDQGTIHDFKEIRRGTYASDSASFRGVAGHAYTLHIRTSGEGQYQSAPELLKAAIPVDTAYTVFSPRVDSRGVTVENFDVFLEFEDAPEPGDFYRWDWIHYASQEYCLFSALPPSGAGGGRVLIQYPCCTPCWSIERCSGCINIGNDQFVNGNRVRRRLTSIPYDSKEDYFMVVEQYALSETIYRFWNSVDGQINNTGGIFDKPPATIVGNIFSASNPEEQVLGVFSAAGLSRKAFYLKRNYVPTLPYPKNEQQRLTQNTCEPCEEGFFRTPKKPFGW